MGHAALEAILAIAGLVLGSHVNCHGLAETNF